MQYQKLWEPSAEEKNSANVSGFISAIEQRYQLHFGSYADFYAWSVKNYTDFWEATAHYCSLIFSKRHDQVFKAGNSFQSAEWFSGSRLNFAENLLRYADEGEAIAAWNEKGKYRSITYRQLNQLCAAFQNALLNCGIKVGDRVAACLPNIPEAVIAMLGTTASGAIWSACSPEFSAAAMIDRFSQIDPTVLIICDGYIYKGKQISIVAQIEELAAKLNCLEKIVIVPYLGIETPQLKKVAPYAEFFPNHYTGKLHFEQLPANHPLYILYSSGTTGKPKCIVHSAIGILLEHSKELCFEADLKRQDRFFYNTTCSWMMWNWLVSGLGQGCTIVLYDGFALASNGKILFSMSEQEKISIFGTSASFLQKIEELGLEPGKIADLRSLRAIFSTGSRLRPESFDFVYRSIANVRLSPIWGGTDLCGCLGTSSPLVPVYRDQIQTRGLGLAVEVFDDRGKSVLDEAGEVVVTAPFPSVPLMFLDDRDGSRLHEAYFSKFPGVWHHGDFAILCSNGGITVLGRSDDTLNPGGVRIGAAEITSVVERHPAVSEAMAVAHIWQGEERIVLFVVLKSAGILNKQLKDEILRQMPSARHRPRKIIAVKQFPVTISGKKSARAIRDIINGGIVKNMQALANPESLSEFSNLEELQSD